MEKYLVKTVNNTEADASGNVNINGSQTPWTSNINAAGYTLFGNSISGGTLTLSSTSHATKGKILFGTSAYDEVNNRLGINTTTPLHGLDVKSDTPYNRLLGNAGTGFLIGSFTSSEGAIWDAATTPTYSNYIFLTSSGHTLLNAAIGIQFRINNIIKMAITNAGSVGIGLITPDASAKLELSSTTQGFLPPRMTATQASAIASPAKSLIVYVTDTNGTFTSAGIWIFTTSWKLILAE